MSEDGVDLRRRRFLTATTAVVGGIGGAFAAVPFVSSLLPSEKAKALGAPVQIDISKIEPGMLHRDEWRGKLVMIVRRTAANLESRQISRINSLIQLLIVKLSNRVMPRTVHVLSRMNIW